MASNNIARLGVVLGLDTAEFTASIDKAISENRKLGQAIKRESNAAAGEIVSLKNATDDYGKTLTKVQIIERDISTGRFRLASDDLKMQLMAQAAAYDQVAMAAAKQAKIADEAKLEAQQQQLATQQIQSLRAATEDYGQTLTKVAAIQREMSEGGRFSGFSNENKVKLLEQAAAYDKVAVAAKHEADVVAAAAQSQRQNQAGMTELQNLKNATEDYGKTLTKVQIIEREINSGRLQGAGVDVKAQLLAQAAAYDRVAASSLKAAGGLTAWQKQGLMYQTTDFFTQVASGQSIMIAAIQQGGQLKDQMGGLGNMFRVLTPLIVSPMGALVAFAATLGLAATAAVMGRKEFDALNNSLILTGQYSGVTTDSFKVMAETISNTSRASIGGAKDILNAMIGSGQFTNQTFDSVSKTIQKFSELSGLTSKEAAAKLIPSLDGSAASAKRLNDQYNFLTLAQYKQIEALARQNKMQESIILTSDLMRANYEKTRTELGYLDQALDFTTKKWSQFWNAAMNWGKPDSVPDQIRTIQERINAMVERGAPKPRPLLGDKDENVKAYADELNRLEDQKSKLIAILVKANADAKKLEGQKKKIDVYAGDGGYQHELSLRQRFQDAVDALDYDHRKANADEENKIEIESYERSRALLVQYHRDIEGKDKNYANLRRNIYIEELALEVQQNEKKLEDFRQKRLNLEIDAAEAERDARKKIADQESEDKLKRLMDDVEYYQKSHTSNLEAKDKLEAQIKMVGWSERQVKLTELEAKYQEDILNNQKQYGDNTEVLASLNAMAEAKKKDGILNIQLTDQLKYLQSINDAVWNNMTSAIDEMVQNGTTSFSKLTESILKDLLKIELKKQALALWEMASGGKGFMGMVGKIFGFADGGDPPVGVPSMVGERGPELFVPKTAGTIVPNHMLGSSQQAPTINYNGPYIASMSAIDTQSGLQFLAKNKQSVWSVYQSANRSIPMSR